MNEMRAALAALFDPCPVIALLRTTLASAMPRMRAPDWQARDRLAHGGREAAGENAADRIGQLSIARALVFPRVEFLQDIEAAFEALLRRLHVVPAIHGAAGNAFEHHDLARPGRGQ